MEGKASFEIEFQPIGKRVKVAAGTSIFEATRSAGIELASACGGVMSEGLVTEIRPEIRAVLGRLRRG